MTFASNINNLRRFFKVVTFLAAKIVQKIYYFFQNCPLIIQDHSKKIPRLKIPQYEQYLYSTSINRLYDVMRFFRGYQV